MVRWGCWKSVNSLIRTGISSNQGENRFEEGIYCTVIFNLLLLKKDKQFPPVSHSVRLVLVFHAHYLRAWEQWLKDRVPTQFSKPNSMTFHDFSMTFVALFPCMLKWYLHLQTGNSLIKNSWCCANGIQLCQTCSLCNSCVASQNQTNIAININ